MEADMLALGAVQDRMEPFQCHAGTQRHVLLHWGWEHPAGVYCFLVLPQYLHHRWGQDDLADGVLRLRLADFQP